MGGNGDRHVTPTDTEGAELPCADIWVSCHPHPAQASGRSLHHQVVKEEALSNFGRTIIIKRIHDPSITSPPPPNHGNPYSTSKELHVVRDGPFGPGH
jgi:hypothetical protein